MKLKEKISKLNLGKIKIGKLVLIFQPHIQILDSVPQLDSVQLLTQNGKILKEFQFQQ